MKLFNLINIISHKHVSECIFFLKNQIKRNKNPSPALCIPSPLLFFCFFPPQSREWNVEPWHKPGEQVELEKSQLHIWVCEVGVTNRCTVQVWYELSYRVRGGEFCVYSNGYPTVLYSWYVFRNKIFLFFYCQDIRIYTHTRLGI